MWIAIHRVTVALSTGGVPNFATGRQQLDDHAWVLNPHVRWRIDFVGAGYRILNTSHIPHDAHQSRRRSPCRSS